MHFDTLITAKELAKTLGDANAPVVVDCGFDLAQPQAGRRAYDEGHIPGACYLHLEEDLSGVPDGRNGRHPLPDREAFAARVARLGIRADTQVVAYDSSGGMYAARLWWLMRWIGHRAVAVLDGGLDAWRAAGLPLTSEPAPVAAPGPAQGLLREPLVRVVLHDALRANLDSGRLLLIDARAPDRFRGENETLDPVGGHIPGARNRLFRDNLDASGCFRPPAELRRAFEALAGDYAPAALVSQCGSGVTACHNLLALEIAGLPGAALYPGSWSEWCCQPGAPIATGPNP